MLRQIQMKVPRKPDWLAHSVVKRQSKELPQGKACQDYFQDVVNRNGRYDSACRKDRMHIRIQNMNPIGRSGIFMGESGTPRVRTL
eukprot:855727-Pelagomonas_calceolata.AAC.1